MSHNSPIQLIILCLLKYIIHVSYDSSVGELMRLTVCPLHSPGSIPSHSGEFQGIFPTCSHTLGEEMGTAKSSQTH